MENQALQKHYKTTELNQKKKIDFSRDYMLMSTPDSIRVCLSVGVCVWSTTYWRFKFSKLFAFSCSIVATGELSSILNTKVIHGEMQWVRNYVFFILWMLYRTFFVHIYNYPMLLPTLTSILALLAVVLESWWILFASPRRAKNFISSFELDGELVS